MAYFDDPRVNDQTVTEIRRRDAILEGLETGKEVNEFVTRQLEAVTSDLKASSPFQTAVTSFNDYGKKQYAAQRQWAEIDPGTDRPATVAELFSNNQESEFYSLLQIGMLVRLLEGEIGMGNGTPKIRKHLEESRDVFDGRGDLLEADLDYRVVPIRKLVAMHLGFTLAAATALFSELNSATK